MLKKVKLWRAIIEQANESQRKRLSRCIMDGMIKDAGSSNEKAFINKDLKSCRAIGLSTGLEFLCAKSRSVKGYAFDAPAILFHSPKYPAIWIAGPEITESYQQVPTMVGTDVKDRYSWVGIMAKAKPRNWTMMMKCIFKAQEFFRASYSKISDHPPKWKLRSKKKLSVQFSKMLQENKNLEFMGFCTNNAYYRFFGDKLQMEAEWVHAYSSPPLLYKHKFLPVYLVAGHDIMFNNSIVKDIPINGITESFFGITG